MNLPWFHPRRDPAVAELERKLIAEQSKNILLENRTIAAEARAFSAEWAAYTAINALELVLRRHVREPRKDKREIVDQKKATTKQLADEIAAAKFARRERLARVLFRGLVSRDEAA